MTDSKKHRFLKLSDFLSYRKNELTGKERNSIERELQKDPFASEAMDGYDSADPENIAGDLADLQSRLQKRTSNKGKLMFYRIAASIAVLIAVSSIFILTKENKPSTRLAENYARPETLEIRRSEPVVESELSEAPVETISREKKKDIETLKAPEKEMNKKAATEEIPENAEKAAPAKAESRQENAGPDLSRAPASAMAREKSFKFKASDKAISDSDTLHSVLISPYIAESEGYISPRPANGIAEFEKYVRENIRYPESFEPGHTVFVSVSFIVRDDGSIKNIIAENSPGKSFSDEAIRLIKDGPAWKPAEKSGIISEDKVRVTIVFR